MPPFVTLSGAWDRELRKEAERKEYRLSTANLKWETLNTSDSEKLY